MKVILLIITAVLLVIIVCLLMLHNAMRSLVDQISDLDKEDTNQLIRNKSGLKVLNPLINSINDLLVSLREKSERANRSNREVRESLTEISHDLRTPLTAASGYIGILKTMDLTDEEKLRYIEVIEERFETTRRLIDQLFYYTRLESDSLGWNEEIVDIRRVYTTVLSAFYGEFEKNNYELQVKLADEKMLVLGDEDAIKRIFSNIISNAITHGDGDFRTLLRPEGDVFRFEFSNRASNLCKVDVDYLFERHFTTEKARSRSNAGLGLAIARSLTLKMGGRCGADLEDGILTIYIELNKYS